MHIQELMSKHRIQNTVSSLDGKRFWVTGVYGNNGVKLQLNLRPTEVETHVDMNALNDGHRFPVTFFKVGTQNQRLKQEIKSEYLGGHGIILFKTRKEAAIEYNRMLDVIHYEMNDRIERIENFKVSLDTDYITSVDRINN